jgi:hypothetical protein
VPALGLCASSRNPGSNETRGRMRLCVSIQPALQPMYCMQTAEGLGGLLTPIDPRMVLAEVLRPTSQYEGREAAVWGGRKGHRTARLYEWSPADQKRAYIGLCQPFSRRIA